VSRDIADMGGEQARPQTIGPGRTPGGIRTRWQAWKAHTLGSEIRSLSRINARFGRIHARTDTDPISTAALRR
jgi:hypothetical protein